MSNSKFSMGEAISFGWETMRNNIGFFILLLIVASLIENIPSFLADYAGRDLPFIAILLSITGVLLSFVVQMGMIKVSLKFCDGIKGKLDDLLSTFKLLLSMIIATIMYFLIIIAGMILLVVPGVIWGVKFSLYPYFIVDEGLGPIEAIRASGEATDGAKLSLWLFGFLLGLINIAGALALLVGLFATIPTTMIAYAYVYRTLAGKPGGMTAPPEASMYINLGT